MAAITFLVVVLRSIGIGWIALQESIVWLHAAVFLLGMAYTLVDDGHVRVDIFYRSFTPRGQAIVDLTGALLLLIPSAVFIIVVSLDYVGASWAIGEASREAGGLPALYLLKTMIPLSAGLLVVQGAAMTLRSVVTLRASRVPAA